MTAIAIAMLVVALIILWGGLVASIVYLQRRPEIASYPAGGDDDARVADAPSPRDT
ncbi:hypothetical protein GCM10011490_17710 [Pseudoclavibacter endophyticus]|uniref:Methionine/alanine import family NSS transporter small subunit n=1 Tax=Pseudoclavibacter endophyticus TaxID=1778590 RepID=A0A6H9WLE7_9MICO|nr:methionine/alanine import family NSS transporter small subunit [Pseudoclavibacter endophyticus]KAB1648878.1 methionine/alanine import family NSS transporter small subunit [Pseudoclavibacter endophyticus]GGA67568.1 hypothetical protein GCM10011490_17710 [Pseudoclavibacter endophyticus]